MWCGGECEAFDLFLITVFVFACLAISFLKCYTKLSFKILPEMLFVSKIIQHSWLSVVLFQWFYFLYVRLDKPLGCLKYFAFCPWNKKLVGKINVVKHHSVDNGSWNISERNVTNFRAIHITVCPHIWNCFLFFLS